MISIAIFNNKGGVGKTTLLCNLAAHYQINERKRVLVIDADPQCNATTYLLNDEELDSHYYASSTPTFYDYIEPYQSGDDLVDPTIVKSSGFGVDLILGDTRLALMEDFISGEWSNFTNAIQRSMKTLCFMRRLLDGLKDSYDYVFVDVGPSLGSLNRLIMLFTDCFLMPMSSDIFCLRAIDNISKSLSSWEEAFNKLCTEYSNLKGDRYKINGQVVEVNPMFIGYVNQQYTSRSKDGVRRAVRAYENILVQIPEKIANLLLPYYPEGYDIAKLKIGEIPNFNSLIPMSQSAHKAIFTLSASDGVFGSHFSKVDDFNDVIKVIAGNLNRNLTEYGMA